MQNPESTAFPLLFISHGAVAEALSEDVFIASLRDLSRTLPRPRAIVTISGHWWEPGPSQVGAVTYPSTIHDFSGYPAPFYQLRYPAPGDPELAEQIAALLNEGGEPAELDRERGLDHGTWVPLRAMYPQADIPVLQLSIPAGRSPYELAGIGALLRPLRDRGVLLIGSGGTSHNLFLRRPIKEFPAMEWAVQFDRWLAGRLAAGDREAILDFERQAPHAALAVPTPDHFDPIFYVLGLMDPGEQVRVVCREMYYGCLSCLTFVAEPPHA